MSCSDEYQALMNATSAMNAPAAAQTACNQKYAEAVHQYKDRMIGAAGPWIIPIIGAAFFGGGALALLTALLQLGANVPLFEPVIAAAREKIAADNAYDAATQAYWQAARNYEACVVKNGNPQPTP